MLLWSRSLQSKPKFNHDGENKDKEDLEGDSSTSLFFNSLLIPPLRRKKESIQGKRFGFPFLQVLLCHEFFLKWFGMQKASIFMGKTYMFLSSWKRDKKKGIFLFSSYSSRQGSRECLCVFYFVSW